MGKPKIRFKGFTEDWEQRKLGETLYSLRNNTLSRAELSLENGVAKNVHYGDILVKFGEILDVKKELLPMIVDELVLAKYRDSFLQNGDIVIADTAEDETVGKCSEIEGVSDEKIIAGLHTIPCRPLFNFASGYLGYYLNSDDYHRQLLPLMQGIKVTSISKSALQDTKIQYPKSLEEQEQIGTYFRWFDYLITLHQRKCDETKKLKKYMLQKMFPQNGMKVPEIRFEEFTGDWEQRKVGEFYDFKNGLNKGKEFFGEGTPIVNFTDVFHNRDIYAKSLKGKVTLEPNEIKNYEVKKGDIFFTRTSEMIEEIGYPSVMLDVAENTVFSGFVLRGRCCQSEDPLDDLFKKYVFFTDAFREEMLKKSSMTTRALTSGTVIKNMIFRFPKSKEEQHKIAEYLTTLDYLITLHQRKRDELVKIKKYMLQNMFV